MNPRARLRAWEGLVAATTCTVVAALMPELWMFLLVLVPVGFAMILVQLVMAMVARSTPTLNLFAVGLPATLLAGLVLLAMAAPVMADSIANALKAGLDMSQTLSQGSTHG